MRLSGKSGQGLLPAIQYGIDADDGVFRRKLLVRHVDGSIAMEHSLKAIDGLEPCEVLDVPVRFRKVPRHDYAVWQFLHIVRTGRAWLKEDADRRSAIDQRAGRFPQRIKAANGYSAIAGDSRVRVASSLGLAKADRASSANPE